MCLSREEFENDALCASIATSFPYKGGGGVGWWGWLVLEFLRTEIPQLLFEVPIQTVSEKIFSVELDNFWNRMALLKLHQKQEVA